MTLSVVGIERMFRGPLAIWAIGWSHWSNAWT